MKVVLRHSTIHRADLDKPIVAVEPCPQPPQVAKLTEPTLVEMLDNFSEASKRAKEFVSENGVAALVVPKDIFEGRLNQGCRQCPGKLWDETARGGLGKCNHPRCGCTKLKLWLASESCPLDAWPR